jgi:hypothetical protein
MQAEGSYSLDQRGGACSPSAHRPTMQPHSTIASDAQGLGAPFSAVVRPRISGGMMALPLSMHGSSAPYAMPVAGFQQLAHPARPARVQGSYYMTQAMPGMRLQRPSQMQHPHMHMTPYYVMPYSAQARASMPGLAIKTPVPPRQPPRPQAAASGSTTTNVSGALDSTPSSTPSASCQRHPSAGLLYAVDHNQQLIMRHQRIYRAQDTGAEASQDPSPMVGQTLLPLATPPHLASQMYMSPQEVNAIAGQTAVADPGTPSAHPQHLLAGSSAAVVQHLQMPPTSSCNPSAASTQSNALYVDFRKAAGASQAAGIGAPDGQGPFCGPVFRVAPGQWQHAGRPVYTLQPCYVQGGYVPGGAAMLPSGSRSPQGSTVHDMEQTPLDAA